MEYSQFEYDQHLVDPTWTSQETAYLFDLLREYDLRFVVVADRYEYAGKKRSIEEIKDRYYTICRRLVRTRTASDPQTQQQLLQAYAFDKGGSAARIRADLSPRDEEEAVRLGVVSPHRGGDCRGGGALRGDQEDGTKRAEVSGGSRRSHAHSGGVGQWFDRFGTGERGRGCGTGQGE